MIVCSRTFCGQWNVELELLMGFPEFRDAAQFAFHELVIEPQLANSRLPGEEGVVIFILLLFFFLSFTLSKTTRNNNRISSTSLGSQ